MAQAPKKKAAVKKPAVKLQEIEVKEPVTVSYEDEAPKVDLPIMKDTWEIKDRTYVLTTSKTPILMTMPSRHTGKRPLLWFDEEKGYQRELRYATNQKSCFADEQEGHVTLAHIPFRDGTLFVPRQKQNLQKLLSLYHPLANVLFREYDEVVNANADLDIMDLRLEAENAAANMDIDMIEAILRVEIGSKVSKMTSRELKRDVRLFARNNAKVFLQLAADENVLLRNLGVKAVEAGMLKLASDQRTFSWASTGRKVMTVPYEENPYSALAAFFKTDEGMEVYKAIEKRLG